MTWRVLLAGSAARQVKTAPAKDRERLVRAIEGLAADPFAGDYAILRGRDERRRRIGDWRIIIYALDGKERIVMVRAIVRRSSTTYRQR